MKASFAIAAVVAPQAPVVKQGFVKQDQAGAFHTTLSLFLPASAQSGMQAAKPVEGGSPENVTATVLRGPQSPALGEGDPGTHPVTYSGTQPGGLPVGTGQPQPGVQSGVKELPPGTLNGPRPTPEPRVPGPAHNVLPVTRAKTQNATSIPQNAGAAAKVTTTVRQRSSSSQGASDPPPPCDVSLSNVSRSDLSALMPPAAAPILKSLEGEKVTAQSAAQHTSPQSWPLAPLSKTVPQTISSTMQGVPASASTPPGTTQSPHDGTSASPGNASVTNGPSPAVGAGQANPAGSPAVALQSHVPLNAVPGSLSLRRSRNNTPPAPAATKPTRVDELAGGPDHTSERLRVSPTVALHGTFAAQVKEISSPAVPSKVSEGVATSASVLQCAAESTRSNGAPMATQAGAQNTASNVLQKMDAAVPAQTISLRADSRHLDVGVQSSALGWIEVRATSGASGSVDATIHVQNDALARDVASHSGNIVAFAREHSVGVGQLSVGVGSGGGGRQDHREGQQAAGEQKRVESGSVALASPMDGPPGLSLISVRA